MATPLTTDVPLGAPADPAGCGLKLASDPVKFGRSMAVVTLPRYWSGSVNPPTVAPAKMLTGKPECQLLMPAKAQPPSRVRAKTFFEWRKKGSSHVWVTDSVCRRSNWLDARLLRLSLGFCCAEASFCSTPRTSELSSIECAQVYATFA